MIRWNKGLCNNYLEVGGGGGVEGLVWKISRGGHRRK